MSYENGATEATNLFYGPLEKTAISPTAIGFGTMLGGHVGTNALGLAAHHNSNVNEQLSHLGFQHALIGSKITPARLQAMKSLLGPESTLAYEAAHGTGKMLVEQHPNPTARYAAMQAMLSGRNSVDGAPIADDVAKAIHHEVMGTQPVPRAEGRRAKFYNWATNRLAKNVTHGMETPAQKIYKGVTGIAPLGMAMAADTAATLGHAPLGAALHFGWNGLRQTAGHTPIGKRMMTNEFAAGLRGEKVSPLREKFYNYMVSPAFLDARRAGQHLNSLSATHPQVLTAANQLIAERGKAGITANDLKGLFHKIQNTPGALPQAGQALDMSHVQTALKAISPKVQGMLPPGTNVNLDQVQGVADAVRPHLQQLLKPGDIGEHNVNNLLTSLQPAVQRVITPKPTLMRRVGTNLKRTLRL